MSASDSRMPSSRTSTGDAEADFELHADWDAEAIAALTPAFTASPEPLLMPDEALGDWPPIAPWLAQDEADASDDEPPRDRSVLDAKLADIAARLEGVIKAQDPAPLFSRFGERLDNFEARVEAVLEKATARHDGESLRLIEGHVREIDGHLEKMRGQLGRLSTIDARVSDIWDHSQLDLPAPTPAPAAGLGSLVEGAVSRALAAASVLDTTARSQGDDEIKSACLARIEEALGRLIERVEAIEDATHQMRPEDPHLDIQRIDAAFAEGARALGGEPALAASWCPIERGHVLHAADFGFERRQRQLTLAEILPPARDLQSGPEIEPVAELEADPTPSAAVPPPVPSVRETAPTPTPTSDASDGPEHAAATVLEEFKQSALRARERLQGMADLGEANTLSGNVREPRKAPTFVPPDARRPLSQGRWYRGFFLAAAMVALGGASFMVVERMMSAAGAGSRQATAEPAQVTEPALPVATSPRADVEANVTPAALPPSTEIESPGAEVRAATLPATIGSASLRHAAANGDPPSEFEIGVRYADGRGVTPDLDQAFIWFQRSAMHGYPPAQFRVAAHYERGIGIAKDGERAKIWYRRAAEKGHVKAMHNLAVLLASAPERADYAQAAQWFREAAERDLPDSQFNLAMMYETGRGVDTNLAEACKWYALAARRGDPEAGRRMLHVRARLSQGEIAAVEKSVAGWVPTPMYAMPGNASSERAAP